MSVLRALGTLEDKLAEACTYWVPLLSGLEVSLRKPVYSMVTVWPG